MTHTIYPQGTYPMLQILDTAKKEVKLISSEPISVGDFISMDKYLTIEVCSIIAEREPKGVHSEEVQFYHLAYLKK